MGSAEPNRLDQRLALVRERLPRLWDRAAAALAAGQDYLASLALRRRRVLLRELDSVERLIDSPHHGRLAERIEAADRLLDASLNETATIPYPTPGEPLALDFDPAVAADMRTLRASIGGRTARNFGRAPSRAHQNGKEAGNG